jgi:hypothetical protein
MALPESERQLPGSSQSLSSLTSSQHGQLPLSTKILVETTVASALAGLRKEINAIDLRVAQTVKAERKERDGQFVGLRTEFRDQQQVVRSEVAEIAAALRKVRQQEQNPSSPVVATYDSEKFLGIYNELEALKGKAAATAAAFEQMKKEIATSKQAADEGKEKTAACIDDYVQIKGEVKGLQKTMFEWQAFRVKQDANMARVSKLFEDHADDFTNVRKFDQDIMVLMEQLLTMKEEQGKIKAEISAAKKKTAECIDEGIEIKKCYRDISKTFDEYNRECESLIEYLPETKKNTNFSLFDRMKIMFNKEHKLQPLINHVDDLKSMVEKTFASLEGELRAGLQKEKEDQLLSAIGLDQKLQEYFEVEKRQAARLQTLEDYMNKYGVKVDELPTRADITKQLMESTVDRDIKLQALAEKLTRHSEELVQQKQKNETLEEDFTQRNKYLEAELNVKSDALQQELAKRDDCLQKELNVRSDLVEENARKYTAETFQALRKQQLLDVQNYVKQEIADLKKQVALV